MVLSNAQAGRAHASARYQAVGVSQSAMAAADAGLANVLEPATGRVTAADREDHSDGCGRVEVSAAAAGSWARPMPRRVTGCVSAASAGAGSRSRYFFLSSRSSNSIPEAEPTLKLARHHASRHTILPRRVRAASHLHHRVTNYYSLSHPTLILLLAPMIRWRCRATWTLSCRL